MWAFLEYGFKSLEMNILTGVIGEYLARSYIRNVLASRLMKKERWDHVVFSKNDYKHSRSRALFDFNSFRRDFTLHGFDANTKLLSKYAMTVGLLRQKHCTPDGLLMKLRQIGQKQASVQSKLTSTTISRIRNAQRLDYKHRIPTVEGDLEVIEIKCGRKAKLMKKQKETYNHLVAKGIPLRIIRVKIVSFDSNKFLVEDKKFA